MSLTNQIREYEQKLRELKGKGFQVYIKHMPPEQGKKKLRLPHHTPKYCTMAIITGPMKEGGMDTTEANFAYGESFCSPKDTPNRKLGWAIAVGRALAQLEKNSK